MDASKKLDRATYDAFNELNDTLGSTYYLDLATLTKTQQKIHSQVTDLRLRFVSLPAQSQEVCRIYGDKTQSAINIWKVRCKALKKIKNLNKNNSPPNIYRVFVDNVSNELHVLKREVVYNPPRNISLKPSIYNNSVTPHSFYLSYLNSPTLFCLLSLDSMYTTVSVLLEELNESVKFNKVISFIIDALELIPQEYPNEFSIQDLEILEDIRQKFLRMKHFDQLIGDFAANANVGFEKNQIAIDKLTQHLNAELDKLAPGDTYPFIWGWMKINTHGHRMLIDFKKLAFNIFHFDVYTTGAGSSHLHREVQNEKIVSDTKKPYRIQEQELRTVLTPRLFESMVLCKCSEIMEKNAPYNSDTLFTLVRPYEMAQPEQITQVGELKKEQLDGTCEINILFAYIYQRLPAKGKTFKNLLERLCVGLYFENNPKKLSTLNNYNDFGVIWLMSLSRVVPNLFRNLEKKIKNNTTKTKVNHVINELYQYRGIVQSHFPEVVSTNIPYSALSLVAQVQVIPNQNFTSPIGFSTLSSSPGTYPRLELTIQSTIISIYDFLNNTHQFYSQTYKKTELTPYVLSSLRAIGRHFLDIKNNQLLLRSMVSSPHVCEKVIDCMEQFLTILFKQAQKILIPQEENINVIITLLFSYVIVESAASILDEKYGTQTQLKISSYPRPQLKHFWNIINETSIPIFNAQDETDLITLRLHFSVPFISRDNTSTFKNELDSLFSYSTSLTNANYTSENAQILYYLLRTDSCEYEYLNGHFERIPLSNFVASDRDYFDKKKYNYNHTVTLDDWRLHSLFVNNLLPRHYYVLRKIVLYGYFFSPFQKQTLNIDCEFHNLYLVTALDTPLISFNGPPDYFESKPSNDRPIVLPEHLEKKETFKSLYDGLQQKENVLINSHSLYYRDLVSIISQRSELQLLSLLNYLYLYPQRLINAEERAIIEVIFLLPYRICNTFEKVSSFDTKIEKIFQYVIDFYSSKNSPHFKKTDRLKVNLFIRELKVRILTKIQAYKRLFPYSLLDNERKKLFEMLKDQEYSEDQSQLHLYMIIIESYGQEEVLSKSDLKQMILSIGMLGIFKAKDIQNQNSFPYFHSVIREIVHRKTLELFSVFTEIYNILNQILSYYKLQSITYQCVDFPIVEFHCNGFKWKYNILNGSLFKIDTPAVLGVVPIDYLLNETYRKLFKKHRVPVEEVHNLFVTNYYGLKLYFKNDFFKLEYNQCEYINSPTTNYKVDQLPDAEYLMLWVSYDKSQMHSIVTDSRTGQIVSYIDGKGCFSFVEEPQKKYEMFHFLKNWHDNFPKFYLKPLILKEIGIHPNKDIILIFSNYRDELGNKLQFYQQNDLWMFGKASKQFISKKQNVVGVHDLETFLVLESFKNELEVLIPIFNYSHFIKMKKNDLNSFRKMIVKCMQLKMKDGAICIQDSTRKNAFAAYIKYLHVVTPEHYVNIFEHIKACNEFKRYTPEDLVYLGMTYIEKMKIDNSPEAFALRAFILVTVLKNFALYPSNSKKHKEAVDAVVLDRDPTFGDPEIYWECYFRNPHNHENIIKEYLQKRNNLCSELIVENYFNETDTSVVKLWETHINHRSIPSIYPTTGLEIKTFNVTFTPDLLNIKQNRFPPCYTRQGKKFIEYFGFMYSIAKENNYHNRECLKKFLYFAQHDTYNENKSLRILLWAILLGTDPLYAKNDVVKKAYEAANEFFSAHINKRDLNYKNIMSELIEFSKILDTVLNNSFVVESVKLRLSRAPTPIRTEVSNPLASEPIKGSFSFLKLNDFNCYRDILVRYIQVSKKEKDLLTGPPDLITFTPPEMKKHEMQCLEELNNDYIEGYKKNQLLSSLNLLKPLDEIIKALMTIEKDNLGSLKDNHLSEMLKLKSKILDTLNANLKSHIESLTKIGANKIHLLEIEDCIDLFLQNDFKKFQKATFELSYEQIQYAFQQIGDYLLHSVHTIHIQNILDEINNLNPHDDPKIIKTVLHKIKHLLLKKHYINKLKLTNIVLVFEHRLKILLTNEQVKGIYELICDGINTHKWKDIFKQFPPAMGKTDIIARMLALIFADGYHASIYMVPMHQFISSIYDSYNKSTLLLNQPILPLIYYDWENSYNEAAAYVTLLTSKIREAIQNRELIYTAKEHMRSYLTRYITLAIWYHRDKIRQVRDEKFALEKLLSLLYERGFCQWDELHQATAWWDDVCMTCGEPTSLDKTQTEMIAQILKLCSLSKDIHNQLLVLLKDNKQAHQTQEKKAYMISLIVDQFLRDPKWSEKLGLKTAYGVDEDKLAHLKRFIHKPQEQLPHFIAKTKGKQNISSPAIDIANLLHLLISHNWLSENLSKTVNEHYGVVIRENAPAVASPFLSHLKPIENSNFSHPITLMMLSYIAYIVSGLNQEQILDFIDYLRLKIHNEWINLKLSNPEANSSQTATYVKVEKFSALLGLKENIIHILHYNEETFLKIISGLKINEDLSLDLLLSYVSERILSMVEVYNEETFINAQDTAPMTRHLVGYGGSMDYPEVAPVMDYTGREVLVVPLKGTNGQTLSLYFDKEATIYVIDSNHNAIFETILGNIKEEPRLINVRVIIDVGCHFNGKTNNEVAEIISINNKNPDVHAVVFFDHNSGLLSFVYANNPKTKYSIQGTMLTDILSQTKCELKQLFFFIDGFHATATNLKMIPFSISIVTCNVGTMHDDFIQGGKRTREWHFLQNVIVALDSSSLSKISSTLFKPYIASLPRGRISNSREVMKDIGLYTNLNTKSKKPHNVYEICLHKVRSIPKTFLLHLIHKGQVKSEHVFSLCSELFTRKNSQQLIDSVSKHEGMKKKEFFDSFINSLVGIIEQNNVQLGINPKDIAIMKTTMINTVTKLLPKMNDETEEFKKDKQGGLLHRNNISDIKFQNKNNVKENETTAITRHVKHTPYNEEEINILYRYFQGIRKECFVNFNHFFKQKNPKNQDIFHKNLFFNTNFFVSQEAFSSKIIEPYQIFIKPIHTVLLIRDNNEHNKPTLKIIVGSAADMDLIFKMAQNLNQIFLLANHIPAAWIIKTEGECYKSINAPYNFKELNDIDNLNHMLVQIQFIAGQVEVLKQKMWLTELKKWLDSLKYTNRIFLKEWFEKSIRSYGLYESYESSPLVNVWGV